MSKAKVSAGIATVLLHLLIATLLFWHSTPEKQPTPLLETPQNERVASGLLPRSLQDSDVITRQFEDAAAIRRTMCGGKDPSYRGIGVMVNYGSQAITSAPDFYPGYRAGLRVGDVILNPYFNEQPDSQGWVVVRIERYDQRLEFRIKQEQICYKQDFFAEVDN